MRAEIVKSRIKTFLLITCEETLNKAFVVRLYPNSTQEITVNKTIGSCRFLYNQTLTERIEKYDKKLDSKLLTEKQYKEIYPWLKEASSRALQSCRRDLDTAYENFFRRVKSGVKGKGFPKFKSKKLSRQSYREPQIKNDRQTAIEIKNGKIKLNKLGWVSFRGLSKNFEGEIKSVTVSKSKAGLYYASILVEINKETLKSQIEQPNKIIGLDIGIKEFITCSNGEQVTGIKKDLLELEKDIKRKARFYSRKQNGSHRKEKARIKLAKAYEKMERFQKHFFYELANKLCRENQTIAIENLNVAGMKKNRKLSHSFQLLSFSKFYTILEQKSKEYGSTVIKIDRWFPSSKTCSCCGRKKESLSLEERTYICEKCGFTIDRDLNAAINIKNKAAGLQQLNSRGESVRLKQISYQNSRLVEAISQPK